VEPGDLNPDIPRAIAALQLSYGSAGPLLQRRTGGFRGPHDVLPSRFAPSLTSRDGPEVAWPSPKATATTGPANYRVRKRKDAEVQV
jgi:hypothetical protein